MNEYDEAYLESRMDEPDDPRLAYYVLDGPFGGEPDDQLHMPPDDYDNEMRPDHEVVVDQYRPVIATLQSTYGRAMPGRNFFQRQPPIQNIKPTQGTRMPTADELLALGLATRRSQKEYEAKIKILEGYGEDNYPEGQIITFKKAFGGKDYSYAAIKAGGKWYTTGRTAVPKGVDWDELRLWLVKGESVHNLVVIPMELQADRVSGATATLKAEVEDLKDELLRTNRVLDQVDTGLRKAGLEPRSCPEGVRDLIQQRDGYLDAVREKDATISDLNRRVDQWTATITELGRMVDQKDATISKLETFVDGLIAYGDPNPKSDGFRYRRTTTLDQIIDEATELKRQLPSKEE